MLGSTELHDELLTTCISLCRGVEVKERTFRLKTYRDCFVGADAVTWLVKLGKQMVARGFITHVCNDHSFEDAYLFYRFSPDIKALAAHISAAEATADEAVVAEGRGLTGAGRTGTWPGKGGEAPGLSGLSGLVLQQQRRISWLAADVEMLRATNAALVERLDNESKVQRAWRAQLEHEQGALREARREGNAAAIGAGVAALVAARLAWLPLWLLLAVVAGVAATLLRPTPWVAPGISAASPGPGNGSKEVAATAHAPSAATAAWVEALGDWMTGAGGGGGGAPDPGLPLQDLPRAPSGGDSQCSRGAPSTGSRRSRGRGGQSTNGGGSDDGAPAWSLGSSGGWGSPGATLRAGALRKRHPHPPEGSPERWSGPGVVPDGATGRDRSPQTPRSLLKSPEKWPHRPVLVRLGDGMRRAGEDANMPLVFNREAPFEFESDLFQGRAWLWFKGDRTSPPGLFKGKKKRTQFTVQGRFKRPIPFRDVVTGQEFNRPLRALPSAWLVDVLLSIGRRLSPALQVSAGGANASQPYLLIPLAAAAQTMAVVAPAGRGGEEEGPPGAGVGGGNCNGLDVPEDLRSLGALFAETSVPAPQRKRYFSSPDALAQYEFDTEREWSFTFSQHLLDIRTLSLDMGVAQVDLARHLGGQPLAMMARCPGGVLWNFELWNERQLSHLDDSADGPPGDTGPELPPLSPEDWGSDGE